MRRRPSKPPENHERWLVSYADFITLLFAFFVVMFASTQAQQARAVSDSVRAALEQGRISAVISTVFKKSKQDEPVKQVMSDESQSEPVDPPKPVEGKTGAPDLHDSLAKLKEGLRRELDSDQIKISLETRGLVISLRESAFFASADDAVAPKSLPALAKIAAVIRDLPNPVRLEGHTDSVPIHNSRFRSNWDLSSARAIAMLELLRDRFQIPVERMSVAGYAENAPSDTNETQQGRAHNRRVDVVLLSVEGMKMEPSQAQPATMRQSSPEAEEDR